MTDAALNCDTNFISILFITICRENDKFQKLAFFIKIRVFTHLFGKSASF